MSATRTDDKLTSALWYNASGCLFTAEVDSTYGVYGE